MPIKFRKVLILILLLILSAPAVLASFKVREIGLYQQITQQIDANEALSAWKQGKYKKYESASFNLGKTRHSYWLHFSINANEQDALVAVLSNPFIYQSCLYNINNANVTLIGRASADECFKLRPLKSRFLAFPLTVKNGKNEYLMLVDRRQEVLRFSLNVLKVDDFTGQETRNYLFFGAIGGVLIFIMLFATLLSFLIGDTLYGWYALYIMLMFLFIAADNGFGFQFLWPDLPYVQKNIRSWLGPAAFGIQVYFVTLFLGKSVLPGFFKTLVKIHLSLSAFLIITSFLPALNSNALLWSQQILSLIYYVGGVLMIVVQCGLLVSKGNRSARLYLFSVLPVALLIVVVMLSRFSIISVNIETAHLYAVAILMEITVLAYGLARRYRVLKQRKDQLEIELISRQKENFSNVMAAQDNERKRIAEDLHDDLGGALSAIKGLLSSAKDSSALQQARQMLDETGEKLRYIAHNLMPAGFAEISLASAIEESVRKANAQKQAHFKFICYGDKIPLTKETELNILRIANELVHNVIKHAHSSRANVQLIYHITHLELLVEDNGVGITDAIHPGGIGLKNIHSRAAYIGGSIYKDSNQHGTTIICKFPI